jgi:hypothetical protein
LRDSFHETVLLQAAESLTDWSTAGFQSFRNLVLHQPFPRFDFGVENLLLQPFVDLVGDGIRGFQEIGLPLPISEGNFPVHEEFSPWGSKKKGIRLFYRPATYMNS